MEYGEWCWASIDGSPELMSQIDERYAKSSYLLLPHAAPVFLDLVQL